MKYVMLCCAMVGCASVQGEYSVYDVSVCPTRDGFPERAEMKTYLRLFVHEAADLFDVPKADIRSALKALMRIEWTRYHAELQCSDKRSDACYQYPTNGFLGHRYIFIWHPFRWSNDLTGSLLVHELTHLLQDAFAAKLNHDYPWFGPGSYNRILQQRVNSLYRRVQ